MGVGTGMGTGIWVNECSRDRNAVGRVVAIADRRIATAVRSASRMCTRRISLTVFQSQRREVVEDEEEEEETGFALGGG